MPPKKQTKASVVAQLPKRPSLPATVVAKKSSTANERPTLAKEVFGYDRGAGYGVSGESETGQGVRGESSKGSGVYGRVNTTPGVGVQGVSATGGYAVAGIIESGSGVGVFGCSQDGAGVWGESASGWAGRFTGSVDVSGNTNVGGSLGVGTTQPDAKLDVRGDVKVSGDVFLTGADCAEDFEVKCGEAVEPGTVLVIADDGSLQVSESPYDRRVAGIVSGAGDLRPGITLGRQSPQPDRLPVGLAGRAYCKVDAAYGPIEIGDLLTTSPTPGHAMKAEEVGQAFGSVLGKALRRLESGTGLVPVLIALQ